MISHKDQRLPGFPGSFGPKLRRIVFTHRCLFCPKYFNTFSYAAWHMNECHSRAMEARRMTYPLLLRAEERFAVFVAKTPKKKGYLR